jgi:hypothetical protein
MIGNNKIKNPRVGWSNAPSLERKLHQRQSDGDQDEDGDAKFDLGANEKTPQRALP